MLYGEIIRQHLKLISDHVVADTIDYLEMKFSFQTDDWNGLEKWAHFARKNEVYDIRLTDDCIRKEDHLNLSAGIWKVYLHGNEFRDGKVIERITTCVETLQVLPTGTLDGEPFPEMPASVTEQILARLDEIEHNGGGGGGTGKPGEPGFSPSASVEQTDTGAVITITDKDGTTTATVTNGKNGITPHIGENGNWWIGETDTGISAGGTVKSVNGNLPDENGNVVIDLPEGSGSDEVFVAEYGVTKFAELLEAYNAGKTLVMVDSDYGYWTNLVLYDSDIFQFTHIRSVVTQMYSLYDDDSWSKREIRLAREDAIPAKTSDITNDSGFITKAVADLVNYYTKSQTYTQAEVNALVSAIPKFTISVVASLPTSDISETTVYLVKSGSDSDLYTEYIYVGGAWEILGSQKVDLTGYATEMWVNTKLADYLPAAQLQTAINDALAQAKASGEFDGAPGTSPTVAVSAITGGHRITITDKEGTKTVDVMDGADGDPGDPGKNGDPGRGILSVTRTSGTGAAGTTDTYTITYTDNTTSTFGVYNGKDGDPYTLTSADKTEIAQEAAGLVDVPDVDSTLKVAGAAADAAKVGTELSNLSSAIADETEMSIKHFSEIELSCGDNLMDSAPTVTLGSGWTGDLVNGLTHTSGTAAVEIAVETEAEDYLFISFNLSVYQVSQLHISVGNLPLVDTYFGKNAVTLILKSDGGNIKFTPKNGFAVTISDIVVRKIDFDGNGTTTIIMQTDTIADGKGGAKIGLWNVLLGGEDSVVDNVAATRIIAIGSKAMESIQYGSRSIAIGQYALRAIIQSERNIAIGADAMYRTTGGADNVVIGMAAMDGANTNVNRNVAIGGYTMTGADATAEENVAIGHYAGRYAGNRNTYIGARSGYFMGGIGNVGIGSYSLQGTTKHSGNYNTAIGTQTQNDDADIDYSTAIGYQAKCDKSNQVVIGRKETVETKLYGDLIVTGTDGVKRQIVFNADGTCMWEALNITVETYTLTADDFTIGGMDADGVPSTSGTNTTRMYTDKIELPSNGTVSVECTVDAAWIAYFYNSVEESASSMVGKSSMSSNSVDDIRNVTLASGSVSGATHFRISLKDSASGSLTHKKEEMMKYVTVTITNTGRLNQQ